MYARLQAYVGVCGTIFGRVVDFELDAALNKTILDFPLALYIFRTQNEIAEALLAIVDVILADAEPSGN